MVNPADLYEGMMVRFTRDFNRGSCFSKGDVKRVGRVGGEYTVLCGHRNGKLHHSLALMQDYVELAEGPW